MTTDNRPAVRWPLLAALGVAAAIFLGLFFWRWDTDRGNSEAQTLAAAELGRREAVLERRLAKLEDQNTADKAGLEAKIRAIGEKQAAAQPVRLGGGNAPFPVESVMPMIVELVCLDNADKEVYYAASGTVVDRSGIIVTNQHVLNSDDGTIIRFCGVGFTVNLKQPPKLEFVAAVRAVHNTSDLAILQITERLDGQPLPQEFPALSLDQAAAASRALNLGDAIYIGGYPDIGADTFTFTQGVVSGRLGTDLIKTSALIDSGASGGAAFDAQGRYVGVPTAAARGEIGGSLGYLITADIVDGFLADYYGHKNTLPADGGE